MLSGFWCWRMFMWFSSQICVKHISTHFLFLFLCNDNDNVFYSVWSKTISVVYENKTVRKQNDRNFMANGVGVWFWFCEHSFLPNIFPVKRNHLSLGSWRLVGEIHWAPWEPRSYFGPCCSTTQESSKHDWLPLLYFLALLSLTYRPDYRRYCLHVLLWL